MWFFVSDLHGRRERYERLFERIAAEAPEVVLLGGDLLPGRFIDDLADDFVMGYLAERFSALARALGARAPRVLLIMGNDDPRRDEPAFIAGETAGAWEYIHERRVSVGEFDVAGYSFVPPSPFLLKDWERYDVSRFVDIGCVSPEEGRRTAPASEQVIRFATIAADLERLFEDADLGRAILLFHAPPHATALDRVLLKTATVDHAPLDPHVGSVAIRRLIESRQPLATLHGHIHESPRLTGAWRDQIGRTICLSAAHDGPELSLVRFDPRAPQRATRELLA